MLMLLLQIGVLGAAVPKPDTFLRRSVRAKHGQCALALYTVRRR